MCTVTIIPKEHNSFILTSNRDEAPDRVSLSPDFYAVDGVKVLFPKDELSGGTWIGVSEKNRLICVLNGGFIAHTRKLNYRKSRGIVAKDLMIADDVLKTIKSYDFSDIEPFTIVLADWNATLKFFELVWDGSEKHLTELPLEPRIWSSSTLYDETMKTERAKWFQLFKEKNELNGSAMLSFHKGAGEYNLDYGVVMDRGYVKTTSITQVEKTGSSVHMAYENLQDGVVANQTFNLPQIVNE
ncbi:NRDE family protein [Seonamhaeicola marinus]|uniref:NRDE family protein n=1 Tax=Seonamhaeicola marinus TaxID=1912246 RepID=A0A5D0IM86_9FLAO|nr:NRDE family protein [Seonamhaeicola marinus]TYA84139.1 NRDE family protein [Seonamhaeicola marinus]